jgi:hypothetical protein
MRRPSAAAVAGFRANRVGMDPGRVGADLEAVLMDAEPARVETECWVAPEVRFPASGRPLTIVVRAPD